MTKCAMCGRVIAADEVQNRVYRVVGGSETVTVVCSKCLARAASDYRLCEFPPEPYTYTRKD